MRFRFIIEYDSEESAECIGGVHDTIHCILYNALPYMVDNVRIAYEEIDEDVE